MHLFSASILSPLLEPEGLGSQKTSVNITHAAFSRGKACPTKHNPALHSQTLGHPCCSAKAVEPQVLFCLKKRKKKLQVQWWMYVSFRLPRVLPIALSKPKRRARTTFPLQLSLLRGQAAQRSVQSRKAVNHPTVGVLWLRPPVTLGPIWDGELSIPPVPRVWAVLRSLSSLLC